MPKNNIVILNGNEYTLDDSTYGLNPGRVAHG